MTVHIPFFLTLPSSAQDEPGRAVALARQAESSGLQAVLVDGQDAEPTTLLARLAAVTERIGLIGTLSAGYHDPLELARRLGDLDYLSGGRIGWRVADDTGAANGRNFGLRELLTAGQQARRQASLVESVVARWDERTELRSPQGRPVLVGGADVVSADVVLLSESDGRLPASRGEIRSRTAFLGRGPDSVLVLAEVVTGTGAGPDADRIEALVKSEDVDGVSVVPLDAEAFFEQLVPELRGRGLIGAQAPYGTLRGSLGLDAPAPVVPAGFGLSLVGSR
ncbi:LLM class flavin-dependent oxidoreductase [Kineosporia rhizophila]|uniref:LLM class flavin-dependent oxidoreductase n=1 Tax=Kineosporia TaxID=49184 RepID=UPI001E3A6185|nr:MULTISPECIES: LLM class flavin-dependent oxidoreductase [Kineosporia]MCE0535259.1 LLM class flavin-dependent oxidoreductase [Kineosporia rhizophila]GLY16960.1 hypothetical protein Kisp01_39750 [Kineosporia sp. NBRC 101677]